MSIATHEKPLATLPHRPNTAEVEATMSARRAGRAVDIALTLTKGTGN